ncbi:MAG: 3-keto-5-aminohexanoate cleavage protein [Parvularculaceae bacterium]
MTPFRAARIVAAVMTARRKVILEAAINGAARALQPTIPVSENAIVSDALACAAEGASVIHLHAYDGQGAAVEDADIYGRLIEKIRSRCEAVVYPTLALFGDLDARLKTIRELSARALLEWGVVDPGSVNIAHRSQIAAGADGFVYANPDAHLRALLADAEAKGWRPAYAIYEPGFARLGAAHAARFSRLRKPIYRVMFSDGLLFGLRPSPENVTFYARHLGEEAPGSPWMVSGLDCSVEPIIAAAVEAGAHVRTGLEDAPFGCKETNAELVAAARRRIEAAGAALATPTETRAIAANADSLSA